MQATATNRFFSSQGGPKNDKESDYEKNFASFLDKSKEGQAGPSLEEQLKERELKAAEEAARIE